MEENHKHIVNELVTDTGFEAWVVKGCPAGDEWGQRLASQPEMKPAVEEAAHFIASMRFAHAAPPTEQKSEVWSRLQRDIHNNRRIIPMYISRRRIAAAAAITLLMAVGLWRFVYQAPETTARYETGYGQQQTVTLADGSVITLNANSVLTVTAGDDPVYSLTGEAYFDLAKSKPGHYKTVSTQAYNIVVKGTAFNVLNRPSRQVLTHVEGEIVVNFAQPVAYLAANGQVANTSTLSIAPGRSLLYHHAHQQYLNKATNTAVEKAWLQNKLIVADMPLATLSTIIEEQYGLAMTFTANDLAQRKITGTLPTNSLSDLTLAIETALSLRITQTKKGLIVAKHVE